MLVSCKLIGNTAHQIITVRALNDQFGCFRVNVLIKLGSLPDSSLGYALCRLVTKIDCGGNIDLGGSLSFAVSPNNSSKVLVPLQHQHRLLEL